MQESRLYCEPFQEQDRRLQHVRAILLCTTNFHVHSVLFFWSDPFTTLRPHIGMVPYQDGLQVAVADIPGLIRDAHKNKVESEGGSFQPEVCKTQPVFLSFQGLGISFLRHIERCRCLLYVIDMSMPQPEGQIQCLIHELEQYKPGLSQKVLSF